VIDKYELFSDAAATIPWSNSLVTMAASELATGFKPVIVNTNA
jgi:spore coat protein U-like protein